MITKRQSLLTTTLLSGALLTVSATAAFAQQAPAITPQEDVTEVEEIVVTGSRIPRPNLEQPTPVTTVSSESIATSGTQDLGAILAELPSLSSNSTVRGNSDSFGDSGGLNFPDLRSLGASRTLTLVDGKRHVGGDAGNAAVDLNAIPAGLVERVEVITGGASAIYGSDAVSGVVNIILKDDYEGLEFSAQGGIAEDGIGGTYSANTVFGRNFLNDRLNVTATLFYDHSDQVRANDVDALRDFGSILNPDDTGPNDGRPNRFLVPNVLTDYLDENGVIIDANSFDIITAIGNDGRPVPQRPRLGTNSFAFGSFADGCDTCASLEDYVYLQPETDRYGTNFRARFDLTDDIAAYVDAKYVRSEILDAVQPSFSFGEYLVEPDSAFLTPELRAVIGGRDVTFGRFNADIGPRINDITRETYRAVAGVRGTTETGFADFNWDLSYNYGETQNEFISRGGIIPGNYADAIDAINVGGQIVCRNPTPGADNTSETCVAYNPFIRQNSQAAIDYVSYEATRNHTITQEVISGVFDFDTSKFFNLQGGAIGFAGGFEYREETSENINDPIVKSGITENAAQPDAFGSFDVTEGFVEFNAPILADVPFAYRLSIDGAYRYADYSTVGGAEAYKIGGIYAPVRDLSFRGTYSRAVRAPNITEAFLPATAGFFSVTDPCDADNIDADPDRAANCAADGVPPGFVSNTNVSIEGESSGNPDLDAETATSFTYGVVLQPRWTPGFTFTADYYDIEIEDAIALISGQDIIDNCYDATGGLDQNFCSLFTRGADGNLNFVNTTYVNASQLTTKGWDFEATYTADLASWAESNPTMFGGLRGRLSASLAANYLEELNFFAFADRPDEIDVEQGEVGDPEWSYKSRLTWDDGTWAVTWESRFEDEVARFDVTPQEGINPPESISPNFVEAKFYNDFVVRYRLADRFGASNTELFAGVNNAFDVELPYGLSGNGTSSAYDLYGRQFFAGARVSF